MITSNQARDLRRSLLVNNRPSPVNLTSMYRHSQRIREELKYLGVACYGLLTLESRYLPHVIDYDESIRGVVYGWLKGDVVMLVATDRRVIFLDKKPLFVNEDEITYDAVSGVKFSHVGFFTTVTLHTKVRDYTTRSLNEHSARTFVAYIEMRRIEHQYVGGRMR